MFGNKTRSLRDALDRGVARMIDSGELRRLYEKYGIWTEAQNELATHSTGPLEAGRPAGGMPAAGRAAPVSVAAARRGIRDVRALGDVDAAGHGPRALDRDRQALWARLLRPVLSGYVELIRGTPLMLQLYVLFYLARLPPWVAGIAGLAINYSAYEAEIYRAGLQAIPPGQMEAALALGMSRAMALRRVIVPQAIRIVIPPVTNDFIALFKDTSVCSVITLIELTKQYSILANSTGGAIESRHSRRCAARPRLSAPTFGRHAAAHHDRNGYRQPSAIADRR